MLFTGLEACAKLYFLFVGERKYGMWCSPTVEESRHKRKKPKEEKFPYMACEGGGHAG